MRKIIDRIKEFVQDKIHWYKMKRYYRVKQDAFNRAKTLANIKHGSDGKRYYVFEDKWNGFTVLNNDQMNRVYRKTGVKFDFLKAIYKTM